MNQEYLKNLIPQQLIAATEIEGPMMVIAGPGTGKTQVLSARIAHIILEAQVEPKNILVLTFTDSGTVAVRKRLHSMIGNEAYYVNIFTFHSFAQSIIEEHKEYFSHLGGEIITDIDQITLLRNILDETKLEKLKLIDDPYFYLTDIRFAISSLKREAVLPNDLERITSQEIIDLENDPQNFNKRTNKLKVDASTRIDRLKKTLELVKVYAEYEKRIRLQKKHDFDDMIVEVLSTVKTNDNLRSDLQEKYLYFLVDEYQDTNSAQNQIVELIATSEYFDSPNLFVVGDDDQSIYRFQGASLANVLYFKKKFVETKIVVMTQSHRSTQQILNTAQSLIENNLQRLVNVMPDQNLEKKLTSKVSFPDAKVVVADFAHMRYEYLWIANQIKELVKQGKKYSDFAILLRNNSEVNDISQMLLSHDIPITSDKSSNILDDPDIRNLLVLIRAIENPQDDKLFYAALCQSWNNINATNRIKFVELKYQLKKSFYDLALEEEILNDKKIGAEPVKEIKADNYIGMFADTLNSTERRNSIYEFGQFLTKFNDKLNSESFLIFFNDLLNEIKFTDQILEKKERILKLNRLSTLFDYIKSKSAGNSNYTYQNFLNYIDIVEEYNITISEKTLDLNTDSVRIMTAHKSKGLEFPIVFIPKCVDKYWGNNGGRQNITLPTGIVGSEKISKNEKNEEERRLFFVALTRAKSQIFLTHSEKYENAYGIKETAQSMFLSEIGNEFEKISPEVEIHETDIEKELLYDVEKEVLIEERENKIITNKLENYKLNATALNNYLICPRKFYYASILRIPSLKTDRQSFGTAMHKAMELFYNEYINTKELPSKDFLLDRFRESIQKEIISEENKEKLLESGLKGLEGYYEENITNTDKNIIMTEVNFDKRNVYLDDINLTGKIDVVGQSKDRQTTYVIDYKTGNPKSKNQILKYSRNDNGEMIPSSYYTQLMFYKILTDNDKSWKYKADFGVLDYIEGKNGKYKQETFEFKFDEIENFKSLIKETMTEIRNMNFEKIKIGKTCKECTFHKICWGG